MHYWSRHHHSKLMLRSCLRAFRISKGLQAAQTIRVKGEGLDFNVPATTTLRSIQYEATGMLESSIFALQHGTRCMLTEAWLRRAVDHSNEPVLELDIDKDCFKFLLANSRPDILKDLDKRKQLNRNIFKSYCFLFKVGPLLHHTKSITEMELFIAFLKATNLKHTTITDFMCILYAELLSDKHPMHTIEFIKEDRRVKNNFILAERTAVLADCLVKLGDFESAQKLCAAMIKSIPDKKELFAAKGKMILSELACMLHKDKDIDAVPYLEEAYTLFEKSGRIPITELARLARSEGFAFYNRRKYFEALEKLKQSYDLLKEADETAEANKAAIAYTGMLILVKLLKQAKDLLKVEMQPEKPYYHELLLNHCVYLLDINDFPKALEQLRLLASELQAKGDTDSPELASCLSMKGQCLLEEYDEIEEAEQDLRQAEEIFGKMVGQCEILRANNLLHLANCLIASRSYKGVEDMLVLAIQLYNEKLPGASMLATAYRMLARRRLNRFSVREVKELLACSMAIPTSPEQYEFNMLEIHSCLADYYLYTNDFRQSELHMHAAIKVFIKFPLPLTDFRFDDIEKRLRRFYQLRDGKNGEDIAEELIEVIVDAKSTTKDSEVITP